MNDNYSLVFKYLEKENILIDKQEFLYQIQSHPDYPSLLSIVDTLRFFKIDCNVVKVDFSEINLLPKYFISFIKRENNELEIGFIEKNGESFIYRNDKEKSKLTADDLKKKWEGIILLIEKEDSIVINKKRNWFWLLPLICSILYFVVLIRFGNNLLTKLFFIFPILGVLFSIAALKDLFGAKSRLINDFCNLTSSSSCSSIVNSKKWKIFEIINFSDLGIIFFTSQFIGFLMFNILNCIDYFVYIQKILIICSIPIIILSLYFQKYVEKKWCPICLVTIGIIILEFVFIFFITDNKFKMSFNFLLLFAFMFMFISIIWFSLKEVLVKNKELKEYQLKSNRFIRNYGNFKNNLLSNTKIDFISTPIILGNIESKLCITIITNPFCGHCKNIHEIVDKILTKYPNDLQIRFIIKTSFEYDEDNVKDFFRILMNIYFNKSEKQFINALDYWFKNKDIKDWLSKFKTDILDTNKIDVIYNEQSKWCNDNQFNYTPAIFINGYEYPKNYERENLVFFVNELIADADFK